MATERTCTEILTKSELQHDAARWIAHGARRHVAFVVLEELLQETAAPEVTVTLTIRREDYIDGRREFAARGVVAAAHA